MWAAGVNPLAGFFHEESTAESVSANGGGVEYTERAAE